MFHNQGNPNQYTGAQTGGNWQNPSVPAGPTAQPGGQFAQQAGQMAGDSSGTANFGAHEILMVHEVLTHQIDGINQYELYRAHVKDQRLIQILDSQVNHMYNSYQNLVNFMHNRGGGSAVPYRVPKSSPVKYGLQQPAQEFPNASMNEMDDRDVASGMMGCAKAGAATCTTAALECADPQLRSMVTNCVISEINQAYELFLFMHEKGWYQIPTMAAKTTQTIMNAYQVGTQPQVGIQPQLGSQPQPGNNIIHKF